MSDGAQYRLEEGEGGRTKLVLSGPYLVSTIGAIERELRDLGGDYQAVDLSEVTEIDTVGAYVACDLAGQCEAEIDGASERAARLMKAIRRTSEPIAMRAPRLPLFERVTDQVGQITLAYGTGVRGVVGFLGQIILAAGSLIRHPGRFRGKALIHQLELVGVSALPIVGLMSFLIGIVIAQQGSVQLEQFGAEIYTINLIGRITVRELGTLMTAIMVAGRSGSAFAAQLGTMKITEEIDAMRTIGVSPVEALVIPRLIASVIMMPLLAFWAMLMSLLGGGIFVWLDIGIPPITYVQRLQEVIPVHDLWIGLIKAPVFGFIIALAGCFQGMLVESNSEEVGQRTTTAVVQSIFLVIVLDAVFAVFFSSIGWK